MEQEELELVLNSFGLEYILEVSDLEEWQVLKLLVEERLVDLDDFR